ncbi:L,D-transpeptidase [Jiangella alba]|uniref:Lipoprotein-anchoring transpeptidase ErfK/SrfK n=1 Tax=Jiangella alba TaxID=561176 RepID=A0A1H5PRV4_9ACTN|nr:Ig-like domain-containing protein [Jiangella alba]SEF15727.1 Lipoprotein-anchoring transpeptidase ErfK/SrfK [Jiangella alba]
MRLRPTLHRVALVLSAAVLLTACSGSDDSGSGGATAQAEGPKAQRIPLQLDGITDEVAFGTPLQFTVPNGHIDSVEVAPEGGEPVDGQVGDDGSSWASAAPLEPGASYAVTVVASDRLGMEHTLTDAFAVGAVPDGDRLTLSMQPADGSVVGVGAPVTVRFDQEVTERENVEQALHIASNPQVEGSWHWVSSQEVHFRPKEYWPSGTQVRVDLDLNGVQAGDDLWGGRAYDLDFTVGKSQVAAVDAATHSVTYSVDGAAVATWDTSLGAPEFATRNGTYIVLEKFETRQMTSCNANITCDPGDPNYYDLEVPNSVRLTWSGTFVHSASWSEGSQGSANVSHGCINLSQANGATFFQLAQYGDIVTVANSTRGPEDLLERGDPGMADWNLGWDQLVADSALGAPITTDAL